MTMQELTAIQWFNQELQKAERLTNTEYTTLLLEAFKMQEKQHKETFEAGIHQCMNHVNTGESLYEFQYYFDKKFYI
jgi:hypothetical protein